MTSNRPIRAGIIGMGSAGVRFHAPMLSKLEEFELYAVYDITEARRTLAQKEYAVKKVYGSLDEFLADDRIDLVVVATPPASHCQISLQVMQAHKNVVVEKPIAMSVEEVDEMMAASKRNNVLLAVHHNKRWDPDYLAVKRTIDEGEIGKPFHIQSRHMIYSSLVTGPASGVSDFHPQWRVEKGYGAGALSEWGSHIIDQVLQLVPSKPEIVWGNLRNVLWSEHVDTYFKGLIGFENSLLAEIEVAYTAQYALPCWFVLGDKGTLIKEKRTFAADTGLDPVRVKREDGEFVFNVEPTDRTEFYRNIASVLGGKADLIVKPSQARLTMQVMDAVRKSTTEKRLVKLQGLG